jgi:hypothetical protein
MVKHTISRLNNGDNIFYIHVDSNSNADFSSLNGIPNVYFSSKRFQTPWSGSGDIYAILNMCRDASDKEWDYACFLSETDYPVKTTSYINNYLNKSGKDHIRCTPLPNENPLKTPSSFWAQGGRIRLECYAYRLSGKQIATIEPRKISLINIRQFAKVLKLAPSKFGNVLRIWLFKPRRKHPTDFVPCGGDAWFFLRRKSIEAVLSYADSHPDYMSYCNDTIVLDELFFPTLIYNLIPHKEISNDILRYISWGTDGECSPFDITKDHSNIIKSCVEKKNLLLMRKIKDINTSLTIDNIVKQANN